MKLELYLTLPTSGARSVALFTIEQKLYVALPQLAEDLETVPPNMNGGNSDTHATIFIWHNNTFELFQQIPVHGGEHIDFGLVHQTPMLAIANIRSGKQPNYKTNPGTQIMAWDKGQFKLTQLIPSCAAKSTCLFKIGNQNFLGISEGVLESKEEKNNQSSNHIYRWKDGKFIHFQALECVWGYDMNHFKIGNNDYLGVADHIIDSTIYVWQENQFQPLQSFSPHGGGRGFCPLVIHGTYYLAFANLLHDSYLYQWNGQQFQEVQKFEGPGARNFHFAFIAGEYYLFRTNFITGTRDAPITKQKSIVYRWQDTQFVADAEYTTFGGTDCKTFEDNGVYYLVVSNSLTEETRFRVDSMVYKIIP